MGAMADAGVAELSLSLDQTTVILVGEINGLAQQQKPDDSRRQT